MSRPTQVQFEQVAQACAELFQQGESVSFAKVYQRIGSKGGQQVVSDMIRRWRQEIAQKVLAQREHPVLPANLVRASDELMEVLWKHAQEHAQEHYHEQMHDLMLQKADWQQQMHAAQEQADLVERRNLEIKAEMAHVQGQLHAVQAAHQELGQQYQALQEQLKLKDKELLLCQEQVAQLKASLEMEQLRHADTLESVKAQHSQELRQVKVQADEDRRHFMQQTDELRQVHRTQAEQLREELEGAKAMLDASRMQINTSREESSRWQGKAEMAQQELAAIKIQAAQGNEEAAIWRGRAEALQEMLKFTVPNEAEKSSAQPELPSEKTVKPERKATG